MQDNMTNKRFNVIIDNMEVSIKDNESEIMEYPFSLACESIDDFDSLIHECLEMVGLLNHLHQENKQLKQEIKQYWKCRDKWKQEAKELKEINKDKEQDVLHLYKENEQLKQEVIIYKKAFQQQVQRCTL